MLLDLLMRSKRPVGTSTEGKRGLRLSRGSPVRRRTHSRSSGITVARSWKGEFGSDPSEGDLVDLARLFRIRRFGADTASTDWREATSLVGSRLYAGADQGERRPQRCLKSSGRQYSRPSRNARACAARCSIRVPRGLTPSAKCSDFRVRFTISSA